MKTAALVGSLVLLHPELENMPEVWVKLESFNQGQKFWLKDEAFEIPNHRGHFCCVPN